MLLRVIKLGSSEFSFDSLQCDQIEMNQIKKNYRTVQDLEEKKSTRIAMQGKKNTIYHKTIGTVSQGFALANGSKEKCNESKLEINSNNTMWPV